jgi:peptidyl-prolyl cis-trans isomerase C
MSNSPLTEKALIAIALTIFSGAGFTVGTWYWVNRHDYVVRVNGERISYSRFVRQLEQAQQIYTRQMGMDLKSEQASALLPILRQNVLNQLIDNQLMLQAARYRQLNVSSPEVEREYNQYLRNSYQNDPARMERELARNNYSLPDFRTELRERLLIRKLREQLSANVKVSEAKLIAAYKQDPEQFKQPEKIEARHILIKVEKPAQEPAARAKIDTILTALKNGQPFTTLAQKYSEDTGTRSKGGDLGSFSKGDMVPAFEQAAWALKPGNYTQTPVKTEFGYHLILRGKTLPARQLPYAEAKPQIESRLRTQEQENSLQKWLKQQRTQAELDWKPEFKGQ